MCTGDKGSGENLSRGGGGGHNSKVSLGTLLQRRLSPSLRACSNSCPLSQWCHPTISSSVVPFSSYLQSFPASVSFSNQVAKVLELQLQHQSFQCIFKIDLLQDWWFDLLAIQGTLKSLLQHHSSKASILWCLIFFMSNSHIHMWLLGKP